MVLHVAGGKNAWYAGLGGETLEPALGDNVAARKLQLTLEKVGVGRVTNGNEAAFECQVFGAACTDIFQAHAGDAALIAQHLVQGEKSLEFNLARRHFFHQFVDQDGLGLEFVTPVNQVHLAGNVGQVQGFFYGGVAATDHATDFVDGRKNRRRWRSLTHRGP